MGNEKLKITFRRAVDRSQSRYGTLVSPLSIWEVGMLAEKQRIILEMDTADWVDQALSQIVIAPFSPSIALQSCCLPGEVHGDPVDRILIATAHEEHAVLVTADEKLLSYGQDNFISVHNPLS
jgi:PIN domain nuclease of toxin-antitoxin system